MSYECGQVVAVFPRNGESFEARIIERTFPGMGEPEWMRVMDAAGWTRRIFPALGDVVLPRIEWKAPVEHDGHVIEPEAFPFEIRPKVQIPMTRCATCGLALTKQELSALGLR